MITAKTPLQAMSERTPDTTMSSGRLRTLPPNHVGRWSVAMTAAKAIGLIEAAAHATALERPLNRFITIHLERGELNDRAQVAVGGFLRRAGQWMASRGEAATYLWVLEHVAGTGLHAHILAHVPLEMQKDFGFKARHRWLTLSGLSPSANVIHTERVGPRGFDQAVATREQKGSHNRQLTGILRYHLKNLDPAAPMPHLDDTSAATALGIDTESSTAIYGKRCGTSQNIGATARRRWQDGKQAEWMASKTA